MLQLKQKQIINSNINEEMQKAELLNTVDGVENNTEIPLENEK